MSYRKLDKRKRGLDDDDAEDYSPSAQYSQKKRSKNEQELAEQKANQQRSQNTYHYVKGTGIRRSSRTPKPKVFDDEDAVTSRRSPEDNLTKSVESLTSASPSVPREDRSSVKKQARTGHGDNTYEIGHKRETRRSYQKYLEELGQETDVLKHNRDPREMTTPGSETKATKSHSSREKSETDDQPHVDTTPPSKGSKQKMSQELDGSCRLQCKKERLDESSPKLRTSSRTPVPKRIFSLLEGEKVGQNLEESESNKVKASARNHVPKKTFHLAEEEELNKSHQHIEVKREPLEYPSPKTRTPKAHGTKRSLASAEEGNIPNPVHSSPEIFTEPSPQRVSSRGHVPKKTFSLLEGQEDVSDSKKHVITGIKWDKHKGCQEEQMTKTNNSQPNSEGREPKRRKSTHGHQPLQSQSSSKEVQLSNYGHEKSDLTKYGKLLVKPDHINLTKNYFIEERVASSSKRKIMETPKTSKESTSTDGHQQGEVNRINKRKGKPVKKIGRSSDVLPVERPPIEFGDVKVKVEVSSDSEILETSEQITPKRSTKKRPVDQSSAVSNKSSLSTDIRSIKKEDVEHKPAFSLSELVTNVINSNVTSEVQSEANLKVQKHRKEKSSKKDAQKADKSSEKVSKKRVTKAGGEASVQEHIILKLHLPHSEESSRHKKHHKHKHSSSSHDSSSPKKTHHKKPSAKSTQSLETKQEEAKKNKKISIKFKGLSSNRIDFEVAAESLEPDKVDELPACLNDTSVVQSSKHSMEGEKKKKKLKHAGSQDKQVVLMSPPGDGEHVKLVIKKDKLPQKNKHEVNEKNSKVKPRTPKVQDHEKGTTKVITTRKGKVCSTTSKTKKTAQKPVVYKTVTSYILFCKQYRKKVVEDNPGLEFPEISKKVGIAWNSLSEEDKEHWKLKAEQVKRNLGIAYPKTLSLTGPKVKEESAEPIDIAAYLQLLGESLCTIGACLKVQDPVEVHGSLSVLLDTALCSISPLLFLTSQLPEMNGCPHNTQVEVLDNLAYLMPGLG